jgi:hypothetical protein
MRTTATITTIGTAHGSQFISHEMLTSCSTMATAAKYFNLVYEIRFVHTWTKVIKGGGLREKVFFLIDR